MKSINVSVKNVKNIRQCEFDLSFEKGIYALVGENGCGKSTLMNILAVLVKPSAIKSLGIADYNEDTKICLSINDVCDKIESISGRLCINHPVRRRHRMNNQFRGFYEGSIFYGTRFYDYSRITDVLNSENFAQDLMPVDDFVKNNLSKILHGDHAHYNNLKKIRSKTIAATKYNLLGIPYFLEVNGNLISQYSMSSGECMLISLIDFVNNLLAYPRVRPGSSVLFLIDEVELALHPAAIDRLLIFFSDLIKNSQYQIIVYFSTHSSEVIQKIHPKNLYLLENENGIMHCVNPCYANYAIRNLYVPNGFDFLILVEDDLAKNMVEKIIREHALSSSKLVCVLPGGGWAQLLKLHKDIVDYNALGVGRKIISIYDGDVKEDVVSSESHKRLPKLFLPISSIEKFLKKKLVFENDKIFMKLIGDKYFTQTRIEDIIKAYKGMNPEKDASGKRLYKSLICELEENGIQEDSFIKYLCDDIYAYERENVDVFTNSLRSILR